MDATRREVLVGAAGVAAAVAVSTTAPDVELAPEDIALLRLAMRDQPTRSDFDEGSASHALFDRLHRAGLVDRREAVGGHFVACDGTRYRIHYMTTAAGEAALRGLDG